VSSGPSEPSEGGFTKEDLLILHEGLMCRDREIYQAIRLLQRVEDDNLEAFRAARKKLQQDRMRLYRVMNKVTDLI
jgi:hypothetical protein